MSLLNMAAQMFVQQLGGSANLNTDSVSSALQNLLPTQGGELDLGSIISMLGSSGIASSLVASWLGDGENSAMDGGGILSALGQQNISSFAGSLGLDDSTAADGLAGMLPSLIDQNSSGGMLADALGGGGLGDLAKKLF